MHLFHKWEPLSGIGTDLYWYGHKKMDSSPRYRVVERVDRECTACGKVNYYYKHNLLDLLFLVQFVVRRWVWKVISR